MAEPTPDRSRAALELYAAWLSRCAQGERLEFDELVLQHPELATELREFASARSMLAAAGGPAIAPERLVQLAGQAADFGRYRIGRELGRGGMGAVHSIWDDNLRRELAMKVMLVQAPAVPGGSTSPLDTSSVLRFLDEAYVTGQLDHPGIVPLHELGIDPEGRLYFTMKLVKGRSLKDVFRRVAAREEGWTQTRALGVLLKVCEAMAYAHAKGVVHRDLKPDNVMVGEFGEVYVMDWGLARVDASAGAAGTGSVPASSGADAGGTAGSAQRVTAEHSEPHTLDGDVIGTPAYMPPEQASGVLAEIGPHSDVYALGAMLYHLLAGHMPYGAKGLSQGSHLVLQRVRQGPPPAIAGLAPRAPAELVAICDKAMARDWRQRYRDMSELAADLSAFLERRVVAAYQTGAWAESKKWVERNKLVAGSLCLAVVSLAVGNVLAQRQARRADAKALEAEQAARAEARAREQERRATQRASDLMCVSSLQDVQDLVARADVLWPAHPRKLPEIEAWLRDARELVDGRPAGSDPGVAARPGLAGFKSILAEIEARALPQSAEERAADLAEHSRDAELARARARAEWLARMLGRSSWPTDESQVLAELELLTPAPATALEWKAIAWELVSPDSLACGDELKALLCARRAVELATDLERYECLEALAWALLRRGELDEARLQLRRAIESAPEEERSGADAAVQVLEGAIARWRAPSGEVPPERAAELAELTERIAELEEWSSMRHHWKFAESEDRWWHDQLAKLVAELEELVDPERGLLSSGISAEHGWGVVKRLELARSIAEESVSGPRPSELWRAALASIHDPSECPFYAGLTLVPQIGLLPIGRDPRSGFWEFAHLQSGEPAERGADGALIVTEATGLVFVLLPGATVWLGAQRTLPTARNYDPQATDHEAPVHEVELSAFLASKFELTQGQWLRITGGNPSAFSPSSQWVGPYDLRHPVELVNWSDCVRVLERVGLTLPREAQWEYAARAGTQSPWWQGSQRERLVGRVNLADKSAERGGAKWSQIEDWLDDGWAVHARVGALEANAFGLHDTCGNVWEWCLDGYANYPATRSVDPLGMGGVPEIKIVRGGSFMTSAADARTAFRTYTAPSTTSSDLGLRPVRPLRED